MSQPDSKLPVVLLIDDDQTMHLWADRNLPNAGFELISCLDGRAGVNAFKDNSPNIVIIDIEMPIVDGFETCARIRRLPDGKNTPVIMMTVTEDPERIKQAYSAGATDFVVKPINWEVLVHRLHYMVRASNNLHKLAQSELRLSKAKKMARLGDWEWQANDNSLYWSDEIYSMVSLNKAEFIPNAENFRAFINAKDIPYVRRHIRKAIISNAVSTLEFRVAAPNQQERFVSQQIEAIKSPKGQLAGLIGTVQDITERKEQENKIRHLAYYDEITQLPNRIFFLKFLTKTIGLAQRSKRSFAILFLDLDGFKGINDTYGHQAGDLLLLEISKRLTKGLRCTDMASRYHDDFDSQADIARLGGDEFIILLNELTRPEDATIVAERIQRWVTKPITLGERMVNVGVSMGIAVFPTDGEDSETLLKNADIAMYHAKETGKGNYKFFHQGMALKAKKRLEIETFMYHAVSKGELQLHYQPIMAAESGRLIGAEALMRWNSPQLGFLPPNDFISLAEENGMINQFGEWAIRESCRQYKSWQEQGLGELTLSVNLSSLQFNKPTFISMIAAIIKEHGVDPSFLTFELTETMIMSDTNNMLSKLTQLKDLGIKLSIDDFGTGYSSLHYLNRFPLDSLKIDRSFVKNLPANKDATAIVNAILAMAKALNLKTVAEGVETSQQNKFLQATTCDALQGYFFSKPMPAEAFQQYWQQINCPVA
jgi:diguanylate cyclase (GGDEF)-like protein